MKTREWKRPGAKKEATGQVRRSRIWAAALIGIGAGWAMTVGANLIAGIATGCAIFIFLLIRKGRV